MNGSTDWAPRLWLDTFDELLNEDNELDYGDQWTLNFNYTLTDKLTNEQRKRGWKVCCHNGHGNFQCSSCFKTWFSARVTVLFHYRLRKERGTVLMRPFGQSCLNCQEDEFELPGFSEKNVEQALLRLFSKIRKNCYGEVDDNSDGSLANTGGGRRTKPHEQSLCEACQQGIFCQEED